MPTQQTRLEKALDYLRHHGMGRTIHRCTYSLMKRSLTYITMNCIWADAEKLNVPGEELRYQGRWLTRKELMEFARNQDCPGSGLREEVISVLLDNGDECFGILDGERLVAFCWYCVNPPARINDAWALQFAPHCVYVYFVYTAPEYRGQRLLAHGIKLAAREYAQRGYPTILAFVEWANYSSLASFFRMGFQQFARLRALRLFGKTFVWGGRGAERFDFRLVRNRRPAQPQAFRRTSAAAD